jgi:hypothetical protein
MSEWVCEFPSCSCFVDVICSSKTYEHTYARFSLTQSLDVAFLLEPQVDANARHSNVDGRRDACETCIRSWLHDMSLTKTPDARSTTQSTVQPGSNPRPPPVACRTVPAHVHSVQSAVQLRSYKESSVRGMWIDDTFNPQSQTSPIYSAAHLHLER